jgi:integrase
MSVQQPVTGLELDVVVEELLSALEESADVHPARARDAAATWRRVAAWLDANGRSSTLPLPPADLLAYLEGPCGEMPYSTLREVVWAVHRAHHRAGVPVVSDVAVVALLARRRRDRHRSAQLPAHAITVAEVRLITGATASDPDSGSDLDPVRAAFALYRAMGRAGWRKRSRLLREVRGSDVLAVADRVLVPALGWVVDRDDDPWGAAALLRAAEAAGPRPLVEPALFDTLRKRLSAAVGDATGAPFCVRGARAASIGPVAAAGLDRETWWWVQRLADRRLPARLRDLAYLLVGFTTLRRHEDLAGLRWEQLRPTRGQGWWWDCLVHKTSDDGSDPHRVVIEHTARDPGQPCTWTCPVCAVEDLRDLQLRVHGSATGAVFATRYGGRMRAMTAANARLVLRRSLLLSGIDTVAPVGARSLRAGGAVSAVEAGASVGEVRELLGQRTEEVTWTYLRRLTPDALEVHLPY